jgi:tetratricopeptide (TPR) repeat protein
MKTFLQLWLLSLIVLQAPAAMAQDANPALGRWLRKEGQTLYSQEKYPQALKTLQKASKADPQPVLFVDIARCHSKLGNHEAAMAALERYLNDVPDASDKDEVMALLNAEKKELGIATDDLATDDEPSEAVEDETAPVEPVPAASTAVPATGPSADATGAAAPSASAENADGSAGEEPLWKSPVLWIAVGGVTVALVGGGVIALAVASQPPAEQPDGSLGTFDLRSP